MRKISIALLAGAGVLFANSVTAADMFTHDDAAYLAIGQPSVEQVRLVCDEYGRCVRSRESRRVIIEPRYGDSYAYAPREQYIEAPREEYIEPRGYYEQPRPGVARSAPGVSIGVNDLF
jgi:hypothetical protein